MRRVRVEHCKKGQQSYLFQKNSLGAEIPMPEKLAQQLSKRKASNMYLPARRPTSKFQVVGALGK